MPHDLPPVPMSSMLAVDSEVRNLPSAESLVTLKQSKLSETSTANTLPILTPPITPPKSVASSPMSGSPLVAPAAMDAGIPLLDLSLETSTATSSTAAPTASLPQIHHTPETLYTRIHGKWYDLRDFRDRHPGGPFALSMVAGRDGTILFESYHPFSPVAKLQSFLRKYEVSADVAARLRTIEEDTPGMPRVDNLFDWPQGGSVFASELKGAVREYFEEEAQRRGVSFREATKGTPKRHAELLLVAVLFAVTVYLMMVRTWWPAMVLCPLTAWVFAANVFHDASHFALTVNPKGNFFAAYLFPYFTSPTTWALQHIIGHHAYPNVAHLDPDVAHTRHARRDHPKLEWYPAHEWQGFWYRLAPHWLLATTFGLNIANEVDNVLTGSYNDAVPVGPRSLTRHFIHLSGRALTVLVLLGWPFYLHPASLSLPMKLAFALVPSFIFSFLFMLNSQVNHLTPVNVPASSRDWFKHQVVTAQNFGPKSAFHFWMSGGLNHQIEHHLFPGLNHVHLPYLQERILAVCRKHNVQYTMASGYLEAVKNYITHTWMMAEKPKAQ